MKRAQTDPQTEYKNKILLERFWDNLKKLNDSVLNIFEKDGFVGFIFSANWFDVEVIKIIAIPRL